MVQISVEGRQIGTTGLCRRTRVSVAPMPFARSNRFLPVTCEVWLCFSLTVPSLTHCWVECIATSCWCVTQAANPRANPFRQRRDTNGAGVSGRNDDANAHVIPSSRFLGESIHTLQDAHLCI